MVSFGCHCEERSKPAEKRNWFVMKRNYRCSAFDGYRSMPSDYSTVICMSCNACGRTKAQYVYELRDFKWR
jgi:hypothetical protein